MEPHSQFSSEKPLSAGKISSILLVEDDEITNFFNNHMIEKMEIAEHIHIELNGRNALKYLVEKEEFSADYRKPALILLDINMPVMNGFEFLEEYEKLPAEDQSDQLIVMLTSSLLEIDRSKADAFKCLTDYYSKPLNEPQLREIMEKYFSF